MTTDDRFERLLADVLADVAPSREPDRLVPETLRAARRVHRWPRWLALLKEPPMRISSRVAVGSPTFRLASIMAIALALILAGVAAVATGASLLPSPAQVAPPYTHNGLIAYGSNNDIWTARQDGIDPRQLTSTKDVESSPIWSPDGSRIAVWHTIDGVSDVRILDADGNVVQTLAAPDGYALPFSTDDHLNTFAAWSPDGRSIAVPVVIPGARVFQGDHQIMEQDLLVFDVASGVGRPLQVGIPVAMGQHWSSDGSWTVFQTFDPATYIGSIDAVAPDGTNLHQISKPDSGTSGDNANVMLPDGTSTVIDDFNTQSWEAVALDGTGTPRVLFTSRPGTYDVFGSVSPDGQSVAFIYEGIGEDLHVIDIDGAGERELLKNVVNPAPIWSPDGTRLIIKQYGQFVVVNADGTGDLVPLQGARDIGVVSWQPVP